MIMKTKFTVAVALLGAVLAAPSVVMAEDVIGDEAIRLSTDQTQYNNAVAKRAAKVQSVQSKARSVEDTNKRLRDEAFQPGGVGG
jgi:peptidoglycan hydrolase CwlO-like protein